MREAAFVKIHKIKWQQFEDVLSEKISISPDKLADLYIEVTDHLSYAKTFYPNSNVLTYLNEISARAHLKIY